MCYAVGSLSLRWWQTKDNEEHPCWVVETDRHGVCPYMRACSPSWIGITNTSIELAHTSIGLEYINWASTRINWTSTHIESSENTHQIELEHINWGRLYRPE